MRWMFYSAGSRHMNNKEVFCVWCDTPLRTDVMEQLFVAVFIYIKGITGYHRICFTYSGCGTSMTQSLQKHTELQNRAGVKLCLQKHRNDCKTQKKKKKLKNSSPGVFLKGHSHPPSQDWITNPWKSSAFLSHLTDSTTLQGRKLLSVPALSGPTLGLTMQRRCRGTD